MKSDSECKNKNYILYTDNNCDGYSYDNDEDTCETMKTTMSQEIDTRVYIFTLLKDKVNEMMYNGCFLQYMNIQNIQDLYGGKKFMVKTRVKMERFINCHSDVFSETSKIIGPKIDLERFKKFAFCLSFKKCICMSIS